MCVCIHKTKTTRKLCVCCYCPEFSSLLAVWKKLVWDWSLYHLPEGNTVNCLWFGKESFMMSWAFFTLLFQDPRVCLFVCLLYIQAWISAMGYFVKYPITQRSQTFFKITLPIWPRKAYSRTLMLACFIHSKTNGVWYHCPVVRGWGRTISHLDFSHNWWYFNLYILFLLLLFSLNIKQLEKIYLCLLFYSWELENSIAVTRLVL